MPSSAQRHRGSPAPRGHLLMLLLLLWGSAGERLSMHHGTQVLSVHSQLCFLFMGGFQFLCSEPAPFERLIFLPVAFPALLVGGGNRRCS